MSTRTQDCLQPNCLFSRRHAHQGGTYSSLSYDFRSSLECRLQVSVLRQINDTSSTQPDPYQRDKMRRLCHARAHWRNELHLTNPSSTSLATSFIVDVRRYDPDDPTYCMTCAGAGVMLTDCSLSLYSVLYLFTMICLL